MSAEWYYVKDGNRHGPVALDELRAMACDGRVGPHDIVWSPAMTNWTPAEQVPELALQPGAADVVNQPVAADPVQRDARASPARVADPMLAYRSSPQAGPVVASERALEMLRQTRPWARLVAVLLFIAGGLCVLVGCFGGLALLAAPHADRWVGWLMLLYLPLALLYVVPAVLLNRYASHIGATLLGRRELDLEQALAAQRSFWKFVGITILTVVGLSLVALMLGALGSFR
jgi:hypothetical protein